MVLALKVKMLQNVVVLFDSLSGKKLQARCLNHSAHLSLSVCVCVVLRLGHSSVHLSCELFDLTLIPYLNYGRGLSLPPTTTTTTATPSPFGLFLSPGSLGGSARCIFPWSKPWLCMETELGGLQSRSHVVECFHQWIIFEWMPAFPPQAALNLRLYFLGFLWFFVCLFGERDRAVFSWRYHFS